MRLPRLSVVVPAHDGAANLARAVRAILSSELPREDFELIVVDDGSADPEAIARAAAGADALLRFEPPARGPAFARNRGAERARAASVAFVDADVEVDQSALGRMADTLETGNHAAVVGSYDSRPAADGTVSQYRNLLHHYVHQRGAGDVESFWAGCGAVRVSAFVEAGMFDESRYRRPEIEDVELGYRLRDRGGRIVLDPAILCTHLKRWSLGGMVASDFARRGVPWARLLLERGRLFRSRGLSVGATERASVVLAGLALILLLAGIASLNEALILASGLATVLFLLANARLLAWLAREKGVFFGVRAAALHLVYSLVAIAALGWGLLGMLGQRSSRARPL